VGDVAIVVIDYKKILTIEEGLSFEGVSCMRNQDFSQLQSDLEKLL
jgi:hypothetical protein